MKFPVESLVWTRLDNVSPGRAFSLEAKWYLRLPDGKNQDGYPLILSLTDKVPKLQAHFGGAFVLTPATGWECIPHIESPNHLETGGSAAGAISVGPDGPILFAGMGPFGKEGAFRWSDGVNCAEHDDIDFTDTIYARKWAGVLRKVGSDAPGFVLFTRDPANP